MKKLSKPLLMMTLFLVLFISCGENDSDSTDCDATAFSETADLIEDSLHNYYTNPTAENCRKAKGVLQTYIQQAKCVGEEKLKEQIKRAETQLKGLSCN